jgi:methionyl-tRNA formyltransferase
MRCVLLTDGSLAAPALGFLAASGGLAGAAWGPSDPDCRAWAVQTCQDQGLGFLEVADPASLPEWMAGLDADLGIAFGCPWRLPAPLLALPRLGWINLHGGALPAYRGPQPVFWQIRNREPEAALVAHRMDAGLDTGPILASAPIPIGPLTTHGALTLALSQVAPALLGPLLQEIHQEGPARLDRAMPQGEGRAWPRPGPADIRIAWDSQDAAEVDALVRACNPWNSGAWTTLQGQPCRLVEVSAAGPMDGPPGQLLPWGATGLAVACRDGQGLALEVLRLEEGIFSGYRLRAMGLGGGARFV